MTSLLDSIISQLGSDDVARIGQQIGADQNDTARAISGAVPMILSGLIGGARSSSGVSSLAGALDRDHDGSLLDNLGSFFGQREVQEKNGGGILGHVFGERQGNVRDAVSKSSGLNSQSTAQLLMILAPIVMAALGRYKRNNRLDEGGLSDLLRGERKTIESRSDLGMLGKMFDRDGDGSAMDDLAQAGAGILGGLLGRR